ncbi:restriction endonuclease subunit S [Tsukamurella hominis]|uniref:restriction endonuclease subunit S n=1 Tax=Tsukamurella hominis TaxID=1970232 RepID=UPI0039E7366E
MKTMKLGSVASIERRGVDPEMLAGDTRYLGLEHIERGGRIVGRETVHTAGVSSTKFKFSPKHVLYGKLRPNLGKIARPEFPGVCSTDILPILPGPEIDRDYLAHFLGQSDMVKFAASRASGANLPRISPESLLAFDIPLPPIMEQRRIAAILDRLDRIVRLRIEVIELMDELVRALYLQTFERGTVWPRVTLLSLARSQNDIKCGPFGTQLQVSEFRPRGVPVVGIKNVNTGFELPPFEFVDKDTAERLESYDLVPGDIVMTRKGTIGNCARYPSSMEPGIMHSDLLRLRVDETIVGVDFLVKHLQMSPRVSRQIAQMSPGAVMPGINVTKLKALEVDYPPLNLQEKFSAQVEGISQQRTTAIRALAVAKELRSSLQARAFTGGL